MELRIFITDLLILYLGMAPSTSLAYPWIKDLGIHCPSSHILTHHLSVSTSGSFCPLNLSLIHPLPSIPTASDPLNSTLILPLDNRKAFLVAQMVKHLPTMWETRVQFLGWEGPLEKEMATHSSIHAWKIPWTEEPGGQQFMPPVSWSHGLHFSSLLIYSPYSNYNILKN